MSKIIRRLQRAHYRFGATGLLPLAVRRSRIAWSNRFGKPWSSNFFDLEFDQLHHTDTAGRVELAELNTIPTETSGVAYHYAPISRRPFDEALARLNIDCSKYSFVDYGCGKGRALLLAAEHGFQKIIGVEFAPELCEVAQRNAEIYKKSSGAGVEISIECVDASTYQVPPGNCVLYFYNPFGEELMTRVVETIKAAPARESRDIYLAYFSPQWHKVLDRANFLSRQISSVWSPDWYMVYKVLP